VEILWKSVDVVPVRSLSGMCRELQRLEWLKSVV
jgi:hypothetical protein